MIRFQAMKKLTNRYVAAYDYLDRQEYQDFWIKEVRGKAHYGAEFDSGYRRWVYLTTSRPVTEEEISEALFVYDKGCSCSHDCCGHYFGGAQYHRLRNLGHLRSGKARRWAVPLGYSPNY